MCHLAQLQTVPSLGKVLYLGEPVEIASRVGRVTSNELASHPMK